MKKKNLDLISAVVILMILIVIGVWFFNYEEGWGWVNSFYFTVMTVTTVGYGDLVPTHDVSKIVTSIYSMVSIPLVIIALGVIARNYFEKRILGIENRITELLSREKVIEEDVEKELAKDKESSSNASR